ncbi:hypothetical protein YZ38_06695 [Campylobacter lari]|uniref:hypothetical protein n=1 Tax=Campylobacter sp. RM5063 TaxID=2735747 RepID=UPI001795C168|nr:hypothetical protein [Campylobacter lari]EAJ0349004.1 hypothetical protein [Campylobacter lari]MCR6513232.1 hypothetical protein [Campylobacter lari]MCR8709100.1 hypothetical protein [Campylobacter sp. RM5063]
MESDLGYYTNNFRNLHITKVINEEPTTEVIIFGFATKNDAENANFSINYQPAYGGNTQYPFKKWQLGGNYYILPGNGYDVFEENKFGLIVADFGNTGLGYPLATKKHNGIYTFTTNYKGKIYKSILHLNLTNSE